MAKNKTYSEYRLGDWRRCECGDETRLFIRDVLKRQDILVAEIKNNPLVPSDKIASLILFLIGTFEDRDELIEKMIWALGECLNRRLYPDPSMELDLDIICGNAQRREKFRL